MVGAAACAAALVDNPDLTDRVLEPMTQLLHLIERSKDTSATAAARRGLGQLAIVAGQFSPAWNLLKKGSPGHHADGRASELPKLAETASPARRWTTETGHDSLDRAVQFWLVTRQAMVAESVSELDREVLNIDLLAEFPPSWRGGPVEVHQAHTLFGKVSYAIRWHGYRPALLWDMTPARYIEDRPVVLRCPGLDPEWSTSEPKGETLLASSTEALPPAPMPGESFT